jgi:spermidine/putrescine transport system ATP-binding protein
VFQSYALFPFLSVFDNVAFGLRYQKLSRQQIASKVHEALDLVQLRSYEKRRPGTLSGGHPRTPTWPTSWGCRT